MAKKHRCTIYLPEKLYQTVKDIEPLFRDFQNNAPQHGSFSRALSHIIQCYMGSSDHVQKLSFRQRLDDELIKMYIRKDKEHVKEILEGEEDV